MQERCSQSERRGEAHSTSPAKASSDHHTTSLPWVLGSKPKIFYLSYKSLIHLYQVSIQETLYRLVLRQRIKACTWSRFPLQAAIQNNMTKICSMNADFLDRQKKADARPRLRLVFSSASSPVSLATRRAAHSHHSPEVLPSSLRVSHNTSSLAQRSSLSALSVDVRIEPETSPTP
ncbi:hypothetical protein BCR34DRAFT_230764 [Clohesyomyces aquaticus]|uniref:Uncharacterized protein n=1 Tax=Clohesyomyces aquaticus TaxID=1231657 RepID=A0A1Y1Y6X6_9PLEO|nr:hypothetical protein BCR34DRAFT_230764 [Clohesyomyces aquaticus]